MKLSEAYNEIQNMIFKAKSPKMDNSHIINVYELDKLIKYIYNENKKQIEKMKNCWNCQFSPRPSFVSPCKGCDDFKGWKLKKGGGLNAIKRKD